jgi:hypothetical protein
VVPLAVKLEADLQLPCPEERIPNQRNVLIKYPGTDFKLLLHQSRVFLFSMQFYFPQMISDNASHGQKVLTIICMTLNNHCLLP